MFERDQHLCSYFAADNLIIIVGAVVGVFVVVILGVIVVLIVGILCRMKKKGEQRCKTCPNV